MQPKPFVQLMDADFDGTGATTLLADGTSTEVQRGIQAPAGDSLYVSAINVTLQLATGNLLSHQFGDGTELTTGIKLEVRDGATVVHNLTVGGLVKNNIGFSRLGKTAGYQIDNFDRIWIQTLNLALPIRLEGDQVLMFAHEENLAAGAGLAVANATAIGWHGRRDSNGVFHADWDSLGVRS